MITRETKKNNIFIDFLKSNTSYELKVFIKTHTGYNPEYYLFINFTTEIGCEFILKYIYTYICFVKYVINYNTFCFIVHTNSVKVN